MVRITALMDNQPSENKALIAEHGLSFLIERKDCRFLFDCGAGANVWRNAHRLGCAVHDLDAVVLSHSHYDHAAGYRDLVEQGGGSAVLYTGPHFFEPKYAFDGLRYTDLSAGFTPDFLKAHHIRHIPVTGCTEIFPDVYAVGSFPRSHNLETIPDRFVRQVDDHFVQDDFSDEICLALVMQDQLHILCGCAHPGILNMVCHVHKVLGRPVRAVLGGTHLSEADGTRISATIDELRAMGLEIVGFSHCSGRQAEQAIDGTLRGCHLGTGDCIFL